MRGDLYFTQSTAYGDTVQKKSISLEQIFHSIEEDFLKVFEPPTYPITNDQIPFDIRLIDPVKILPHHKLYPQS